MKIARIYVKTTAHPVTNQAGWAFAYRYEGSVSMTIRSGVYNSNNVVAELYAIMAAIKHLNPIFTTCVIYTKIDTMILNGEASLSEPMQAMLNVINEVKRERKNKVKWKRFPDQSNGLARLVTIKVRSVFSNELQYG